MPQKQFFFQCIRLSSNNFVWQKCKPNRILYDINLQIVHTRHSSLIIWALFIHENKRSVVQRNSDLYWITSMSRFSLVGIVTRPQVGNQGTGDIFPAKGREYFLLRSIKAGARAHPASHPMGTELGYHADHSFPTGAKVKNSWSYTSVSRTSSWHGS
jgi:hypothetical protein